MRKQLTFIGLVFALFVPAFALAAQQQVTLSVNSISPSTLSINAGDTVVWTNSSATTQSVTGNNNLFQSGSIAPGGQFAATFNTSGTYNYYDSANGSAILGEIIVNGNTSANTVSTTAYNPNANYTTSTSGSTDTTVASLESEVQALIAQINAIEGNSGGTTTSVSGAPTYTTGGSCPQIGRVLSVGTSGSDVSSLQQFLGVSPTTGYYGSITQSAVESWQASNNIISYGTPDTTGYGVVGPRTAAAIRLACSGGQTGSSGSSSSSGNSGIVSGFLQVSPIQGSAPLTVNVTATVNTAQSCSGGTYTLSYGDGSQNQSINTQSGDCSQQNETFQHTYQGGGTFTITLSAGTHSSTATVTVNCPTTSVTGSTDGTDASGSMSAFITTGPAPLATTFYVSCAAGLAYDIVFGDGNDLGSSGVSQSSCDGGLQSIAHTYTKVGSYNAQLVVFVRNSQGTISSQNVATQGITVTGATTNTGGTAVSSFPSPTLTPDVGSNPLEVSLQFTGGTCTGAYSITWGDTGISSSPAVDNPSGCTPNATQSYSVTHTYSATGNYTVTLTRALPSGSSQNDTVGVAISD